MKQTLFRPAMGVFALCALLTGVTVVTASAADDSQRSVESMTIDEMVESAKILVDGMEEKLAQAFKALEESIASGDVATTTGRNEAITAMNGLVKLSEDNFLTMQLKAAQGDRDGVEHEYVKITIAAAKVSELFGQVQSAGGVGIDVELSNVERELTQLEAETPDVKLSMSFTNFAEPPVTTNDPVHASAEK